jgi:glycosyltransferase involved in cell wall biosynthesis
MNPDATVFATVALEDRLPSLLQGVKVRTSWLQKLPFLRQMYRVYFLLYPLGVRALDLSKYDCVLSSSSGYAKGVRTGRNAIHICYCHTPMRWAWSYDKYSERESMGGIVRAIVGKAILALQRWDLNASRQPDHFIANSRTVAHRIMTHYGRVAEVIHPPVDVERFAVSERQGGDYYLVLSRLVPYKRIDLAIRACNLLGTKLVIVGAGPDGAALKKIAGPSVKFAGRLSDREVERTVADCKALLFPGEEDFGMAPLELAAAGKPTIAYGAGGALETVIDEKTGLFFSEQTPESLADAIVRFEKRTFSPRVLRAHAERFSIAVFQTRMREFLKRAGVHSSDRYRTLINDYETLNCGSQPTSPKLAAMSTILPFYKSAKIPPAQTSLEIEPQQQKKKEA